MDMQRTQLENLIWEYVYDLLPDDEADKLVERITSEPETARLYAEIVLQSELLAKAAKITEPQMDFRAALNRSEPPAISAKSLATNGTTSSLRWLVGLAATSLFLLLGYTFLQPNAPLDQVAELRERRAASPEPIRTVLYGPQELQPDRENYFTVATNSLDGQPRSVEVQVRMLDAGDKVVFQDLQRTNRDGLLQIAAQPETASDHVRLEVQPVIDEARATAPLRKSLPFGKVELSTHLSIDKPLYRPGESVKFRSVTLSRFGLRVPDEPVVEYRIVDGNGATVPGSPFQTKTKRGVGSGEFRIPQDLAAGQYTLIAGSPESAFRDTHREFTVRQFRPPQLNKRIEFAHDSYAPGAEVVADISVTRGNAEPVTDLSLQILAEVDSVPQVVQRAKTDQQGKLQVRFTLPDKIAAGEGVLRAAVVDNAPETISREIPIRLDTVNIELFPESGDLVGGVENRVYVYAHDPKFNPLHVSGEVIDDGGATVARFETRTEGRGTFTFAVDEQRAYRLVVRGPKGALHETALPPVNPDQLATMRIEPSVFDAAAPVELKLISTDTRRPWGISAVCRGAVVGQAVVSAEDFRQVEDGVGIADVEIPLAANADGVIRLTTFDYSQNPPRPVAERLVYRRPSQKLSIDFTNLAAKQPAGAEVSLDVAVRDENGEGVPAVLGIAVVNQAVLDLGHDKSPTMETHFRLLSSIRRPQDLEDANFLLRATTESAEALDLLLGTQGWRTFESMLDARDADDEQMNEASLAGGATDALFFVEPSSDRGVRPVVLLDNRDELPNVAVDSTMSFAPAPQSNLNRAGLLLILGSLATIVLLAVPSLIGVRLGIKLWAPSAAIAVFCLVVGSVWLTAEVNQVGELAYFWSQPPGHGVEAVEFPAETGNVDAETDNRLAFESSDGLTEGFIGDDPEMVPAEALMGGAAEEPLPDTAFGGFAEKQAVRREGVKKDDGGTNAAPTKESARRADTDVLVDKPAVMMRQSDNAQERRAAENQVANASRDSEFATPSSPLRRKPAPASDMPVADFAADAKPAPAPEAMLEVKSAAPRKPPAAGLATATKAQDESENAKALRKQIARADAVAEALDDSAESPSVPLASAANDAKRVQSAPPPKAMPLAVQENAAASNNMRKLAEADAANVRAPSAEAPSADRSPADRLPARQDLPGLESDKPLMVRRRYADQGFSNSIERSSSNRDSIYWDPLAITDEDGRTGFTIKLPPQRATFRILVDGHTDGRVGSSVQTIASEN